GLLHVTPILTVLPDDSLLGEFRQEFAGTLGMIEAYPTKPDDAPGFAGAAELIDSDSLRQLLQKDPRTRVDAGAYLTARLMDVFLNDSDRHPGNWKWARMRSIPGAPWLPIGRDRDKVFISYGGTVAVAGKFSPKLITFQSSYPAIRGLIWNSLELDGRLLGGLEKPVWDSVAAVLRHKLSDQVIDAAVLAMPVEYQHSAPGLAATLKQRRDGLSEIATRIYLFLAAAPDIQASDAADRASVLRMEDGSVEVQIQAGDEAPWFRRRFHPSETDEIRLYLHGGDDSAVVTGEVARSMRVRIIGGNGSNTLIDSSRVGGRAGQARFYDLGSVSDVAYGPDTLFNRLPWVISGGGMAPPERDRGEKLGPVFGLSAPGDLGLLIRVGVSHSRYGFRVGPYAGRTVLTTEYASGVSAWRLTGFVDRRREGTRWHFTARARVSKLEVINFHGLGNATANASSDFFRVRQRQFLLLPAVAFTLGTRGDLSLGPVLQYSTTDSAANTFISSSRPYGAGTFGQAGLRLGLRYDARDQANYAGSGILLDLSATWFPGIWDVDGSFAALSAVTAVHYSIPVPLHPILVLRAQAKKLFGEFPFHESAFIGGSGSVRSLELQRYAGDASLGGTTELRLPLGRVPLILPLDLGVYGFADAGRVFLDGKSPGGWHSGTGLGLWIGILNPATALNFELGTHEGRTRLRVKTGMDF
ncbi:MAG TPA: BamA/TamA family outer membrane protein, partial [Gemmatimonadales bacterium]|nr:BamA/TamA family outer membrane protein [Gemmatimonadales bacterium]